MAGVKDLEVGAESRDEAAMLVDFEFRRGAGRGRDKVSREAERELAMAVSLAPAAKPVDPRGRLGM